jgi:hypothetical protein
MNQVQGDTETRKDLSEDEFLAVMKLLAEDPEFRKMLQEKIGK